MSEDLIKSTQWYALSQDEVLRKLKTDRNGISDDEAGIRLVHAGINILETNERSSLITIFFRQFKSAFIYVLLLAGVLSVALGDVLDGAVIFFIVFINSIVGMIQEGKAKNSLAALKHEYIRSARVIRSGQKIEIDSSTLVPGDVVDLRRGDRVPADVRMLEAERLFVNEAMFTGESEDVQKHINVLKGKLILPDQRNMAFMGSLVTSGFGIGVVVETGARTALGRLSHYLKTPEEHTILQQKISLFAKKLAIIIAVACSILLATGLLGGRTFIEMFTTSVAVAVSAIPEGLAVIVTIILALEMRTIFSLHGLVKTLPAAETLGSTTVVCTDKTGTVTTGVMTVTTLLTRNHTIHDASHSWYRSLEHKPKELLRLFELITLCNDASEEIKEKQSVITGNMTDRALFQFSKGLGFSSADLNKRFPRVDTLPFDSGLKFMATLHRDLDSNVLIAKGSPEAILKYCTHVLDDSHSKMLEEPLVKELRERYLRFTREGLRVLAVCYKELPKFLTSLDHYPIQGCVFVGFIGLHDPIREEVREMVQTLRKAHVKTMLVTGDHVHTAQVAARAIGLPAEQEHILQGSEIESLSVSELMIRLRNTSICARIVPEDKLKIVQALQESGEVVAMTGDGVNDAPAIQKADIGIALGSGTDVAKEAADIILLEDSFTTIGNTLLSGRLIIKNIRKVILFLLSHNFTELFMIFGAFLVGFEALPLIASQILWKNLIADSLPALALSSTKHKESAAGSYPESKTAPLLNKAHLLFIVISCGASALAGLVMFYLYVQDPRITLDYARSVSFCVISLISLGNIFVIHSLGVQHSFKHMLNESFLLLSILLSISLLLLAFTAPVMRNILHLAPLSFTTVLQSIALSGFVILIIEFAKRRLLLPRTQNNG